MRQFNSDETLCVRISLWKLTQGFAIGIGFIMAGIFLIMTPLPSSKVNIGWYDEFAALMGIVSILFGGFGLLAFVFNMIKRRSIRWTVVTMNADGITDHRHDLFIPFTDIKKMWITQGRQRLLPIQRIQLDMTDAGRYADVERWIKQRGWQKADVALDFTAATAKDFRLARDYIRRHIKGVEDDGIRTLG